MNTTVITMQSDNLQTRIEHCLALARVPAREVIVAPKDVDIEAWDYVGDPIAEDLVLALRAMPKRSGNALTDARQLQQEGNDAAIRFFKDVEHVPAWFDFEETRAGAAMMARNPLGLILGVHSSLPYTGVDANTPRVMFSTGRLGKDGDFERRFWETSTGFIGVLDVDGMKPGGQQWQMWVRIRLLHSMVRLGILSRGKWENPPRPSMPISAIGSAIGPAIFGDIRTDVVRAFGYATDVERDSAARMWQWVSKILGCPPELLPPNLHDQRELTMRIFDRFYGPSDESKDYAAYVYEGLGRMRSMPFSESVHVALGRYLMSMPSLPRRHGSLTADDLGLRKQPLLDAAVRVVAFSSRSVAQAYRVKPLASVASQLGKKLIDKTVEFGLGGKKAQYTTHM